VLAYIREVLDRKVRVSVMERYTSRNSRLKRARTEDGR